MTRVTVATALLFVLGCWGASINMEAPASIVMGASQDVTVVLSTTKVTFPSTTTDHVIVQNDLTIGTKKVATAGGLEALGLQAAFTPPVTCNAGNDGYMYFDKATKQHLRCNSAEAKWQAVLGNTVEILPSSCKAHYAAGATTDGWYMVSAGIANRATRVYCDMTNDFGAGVGRGYTRLFTGCGSSTVGAAHWVGRTLGAILSSASMGTDTGCVVIVDDTNPANIAYSKNAAVCDNAMKGVRLNKGGPAGSFLANTVWTVSGGFTQAMFSAAGSCSDNSFVLLDTGTANQWTIQAQAPFLCKVGGTNKQVTIWIR